MPSTPLKETERRAGGWRQATGVEQTEIDALASLRPDLLRQIARDAIAPFYDYELDRRVARARGDWLRASLEIINRDIDGEHLARIRTEAERKLAEMREQIAELNNSASTPATSTCPRWSSRKPTSAGASHPARCSIRAGRSPNSARA